MTCVLGNVSARLTWVNGVFWSIISAPGTFSDHLIKLKTAALSKLNLGQ